VQLPCTNVTCLGSAQAEAELAAAATGTLRDAARTRKVKPELLEGALAHLDRLATSGHLPEHLAVSLEEVLSRTHRLIFSTATSTRWLQYIHVKVRALRRLQPRSSLLKDRGRAVCWMARG
jgi:hypothetical protein